MRVTERPLDQNGGSLARVVVLKYWNYAGHVARQAKNPIVFAIVRWRCIQWQRENQYLPDKWMKRRRRCGQL
eukprot:3703325-Lingulodinium_polyedra.AAC.1